MTLKLLEINENGEVLKRLSVSNPYITATAFTNRGLVYFGTEEEISAVLSEIERIKQEITLENSPKIYNTQEDREGGFNFKDNDFNLKKTMNETFEIDKTEYFSDDFEEMESVSLESSHEENIEEEISLGELSTSEDEFEISEEVESSFDEDIEDEQQNIISAEEQNIDDTKSQDNSTEEINYEKSPEGTQEENSVNSENSDAYNDEMLRKVISEVLAQEEKKANIAGADLHYPQELQNFNDQSPVQSDNSADLIINSGGDRYLYFGELNENLLRDGYGRTQMDSGKTAYEGNYKNNKRDGFGSYYYKDGGLCYTGEWKNNKRSGFGLGVRSSDGSYHAGGWSDNKPNGMGVRFDKYGHLSYVSNFKDGKEIGLCVEFREDGGISIFKWIDDTKKIIQTIYP